MELLNYKTLKKSGYDGYLIAEWSENVTEYLPVDSIFVTISRTDFESGRKIEIENTGGLEI